MREKNRPLKIKNSISLRIINELIKRNGNDKLYDLCNHINVHQGSIRRRLESGEKSWSVAEDILNIAKYLNVDVEWLLTGNHKQKIINDEIKKWMKKANDYEKNLKILKQDNAKLKAALRLLQDVKK